MNIDARPPVVYPTFHDTQRPSTDAILDTSLLPPLPNKHTPPSWKPKSSTTTRSIRTQRNWFGEDMKKNYHESVLERNTYKNSTMKAHDFDNIGLTKRSRTKSVSFNETVTVILSQDTVSQSKLKQQTEEIFVDALESFE